MNISVRNWLHVHRTEIALSGVFCLIGIVIGVAIHPSLPLEFRFDDKIDAVALLSLIVTIIIAWIITSVFEKKKQADLAGKEIVLKRVEVLYNFVAQTSSLTNSSTILYTEAASAIKNIEVSIKRICSLLERTGLSCDETIKAQILGCASALLDLMTNTPVVDNSSTTPSAVQVVEGKLLFSRERALEIQNTFEELEYNILILSVSITSL
jgi:hypothetical protein